MTKAERAQLLRGVNPLTGQPLPSVTTYVAPAAGPAAATTAPAWVTEARGVQAAIPAPAPAPADRVWTFVTAGTTNSGNGRDTAIFQAGMKNGGTFQATLPGDLVRALRAGKVLGLK